MSSSVQSFSYVQLFAMPWHEARQVSLYITNSRSLLKLMSNESVMPSNHFILCRPLFLLLSIFPNIRVFSNKSDLRISWPKYWSFSFSISPSNEHAWLISFRMDWLGLLAVQGLSGVFSSTTVRSINSLELCLLYGPSLMSGHDYWKNHSLIIQTFVSKVMSLIFNMLSRFFIAFLPRRKDLLISWLQSPFAVILEPKKVKSAIVSIVSSSICHEVMGLDALILVFWMLSFKTAFSLSSFTFIKWLINSSPLSAIKMVSSAYWGCWYFSCHSWFQLVSHPAWHFTWCPLQKS